MCNTYTTVTEITCKKCNTVIKGSFDLCNFCRLSKEEKNFIEVFIKNRGNIKEIEKELKISYPTVRKLLDQVIIGLGCCSSLIDEQNHTTNIINKLEDGTITSMEALDLINKSKGDT